MMQPIFKSAGQAVHFSFLLEALEASSESLMAKMIRQHLMAMGLWKTEKSTVDLSGLSSLEIRAQAAMIRSACRSKLTEPEFWTILSRYGVVNIKRDENGQKMYWVSEEKARALQSLADWLAPSHGGLPVDALRLLVLRSTSSMEQLRPTFRAISENCGGNKDTLCRHAKKISLRLRELENLAFDRLIPIFRRDGVIE